MVFADALSSTHKDLVKNTNKKTKRFWQFRPGKRLETKTAKIKTKLKKIFWPLKHSNPDKNTALQVYERPFGVNPSKFITDDDSSLITLRDVDSDAFKFETGYKNHLCGDFNETTNYESDDVEDEIYTPRFYSTPCTTGAINAIASKQNLQEPNAQLLPASTFWCFTIFQRFMVLCCELAQRNKRATNSECLVIPTPEEVFEILETQNNFQMANLASLVASRYEIRGVTVLRIFGTPTRDEEPGKLDSVQPKKVVCDWPMLICGPEVELEQPEEVYQLTDSETYSDEEGDHNGENENVYQLTDLEEDDSVEGDENDSFAMPVGASSGSRGFSRCQVGFTNLQLENEQEEKEEREKEEREKEEREVVEEVEEQVEEQVEEVEDEDEDQKTEYVDENTETDFGDLPLWVLVALRKFPTMGLVQTLYHCYYPEKKAVGKSEGKLKRSHKVRFGLDEYEGCEEKPKNLSSGGRQLKSCLKKSNFKVSPAIPDHTATVVDGDTKFDLLHYALVSVGSFNAHSEEELDVCLENYTVVAKDAFTKVVKGISDVQTLSLHGYFEDCVTASKLLAEAFRYGVALSNRYEVLRNERFWVENGTRRNKEVLATALRSELAVLSQWELEVESTVQEAQSAVKCAVQTLEEYEWRTSRCYRRSQKLVDEYIRFFNEILVPVYDDLSHEDIHKMCGYNERKIAESKKPGLGKEITEMLLLIIECGTEVLVELCADVGERIRLLDALVERRR